MSFYSSSEVVREVFSPICLPVTCVFFQESEWSLIPLRLSSVLLYRNVWVLLPDFNFIDCYVLQPLLHLLVLKSVWWLFVHLTVLIKPLVKTQYKISILYVRSIESLRWGSKKGFSLHTCPCFIRVRRTCGVNSVHFLPVSV